MADYHSFSTDEYRNLCESLRHQGFGEGMRVAKQEMGENLDRIAESVTGGIPYRFPVWTNYHIQTKPMGQIDFPRPMVVELTREQLIAIRQLLCGTRQS